MAQQQQAQMNVESEVEEDDFEEKSAEPQPRPSIPAQSSDVMQSENRESMMAPTFRQAVVEEEAPFTFTKFSLSPIFSKANKIREAHRSELQKSIDAKYPGTEIYLPMQSLNLGSFP